MQSDPRIGLLGSLAVAGLGLLWLLALWLSGDALWAVLGDISHVFTLLAFLMIVAGPLVALLFRRYAIVRADLLAGRNVIAGWHVDEADLAAFRPRARAREEAEKRGALIVVWFFLVLVFGTIALADPETAPFMLASGALVGIVVTLAFFMGNRISRRQLLMPSGEVIVGSDGLLFGKTLHVWTGWLSWLSGAALEDGPPSVLTISYGYLARYGPAYVSVMLPVPAAAKAVAAEAAERLRRLASTRRSGLRKSTTAARV